MFHERLSAFRRALATIWVSGFWGLLLIIMAVPTLAAATVTWSGDLVNDPDGVFSLTNCSLVAGPVSYNYQAQPFHVDADGIYTLEVTATNFDIWYVLYQGSFDPANPLANCVTFNDDGGGYPKARIQRALTANTLYVLVTSRCCGAHGTFTNQISGPGNITLGYLGAGESPTEPPLAPDRLPVRPDDRLNWMNGDTAAVIYSRSDGANNPAVHVYCVGEDGRGTLGLVVTQADLADIPMPPARNTLVASSLQCDVSFYILTTGEVQINIRDTAWKTFVTVMADLAGTGAYGYMFEP